MKRIFLLLLIFAAQSSFAQSQNGMVTVYGEINNLAAWHSRPGISDDMGVFYLLPVDKDINKIGIDLNDSPYFNFLSIASRAGLQWSGFRSGRIEAGARLDGDFYCLNGTTAVLRVRNAYCNGSIDIGKAGEIHILVGQTKHPLAEDCPHTFALNTGAPFNPYNYSPQLKIEYRFLSWLSVTVDALWQSGNLSMGPDGKSVKYIAWGCTPELYGGLTFRHKGITAKVGVDFLSIKPRKNGLCPYSEVTVPVSDRINNLSPFIYAEYNRRNWCVKGKSVLASSGEHLSLMSGYAVHSIIMDDGHYIYTPYRNSTSWISGEYSFLNNFAVSLMVGYIHNFGPADSVLAENFIYFYGNAYNLHRAARITPTLKYSLKHFSAGISYENNVAQYTDWVIDHCITLQFGCRF